MSEFFLNTRFFKRQSSEDSDVQEELNTLKIIVEKIISIDTIFSIWYLNNPTGTKPPVDYPFPSEKADNYLINLRKADEFQSFSLWNGEDNSNFVSINFDTFDFRMSFEKVLTYDKVLKIIELLVNYIKFQYIYISNNFFSEINIFPHRLPTTSICYVAKDVEVNDIPYIYKKIKVNNDLNKGSILIFYENWADETDDLKKKIQENSIALVELGVIPEVELPEGFFGS